MKLLVSQKQTQFRRTSVAEKLLSQTGQNATILSLVLPHLSLFAGCSGSHWKPSGHHHCAQFGEETNQFAYFNSNSSSV